MAFIVVSRPVTGLCPWPAMTAVTGADVVAFDQNLPAIRGIERDRQPQQNRFA